ncbi:hypothetical protein YC2023_061171 [Brassica napus]
MIQVMNVNQVVISSKVLDWIFSVSLSPQSNLLSSSIRETMTFELTQEKRFKNSVDTMSVTKKCIHIHTKMQSNL